MRCGGPIPCHFVQFIDRRVAGVVDRWIGHRRLDMDGLKESRVEMKGTERERCAYLYVKIVWPII